MICPISTVSYWITPCNSKLNKNILWRFESGDFLKSIIINLAISSEEFQRLYEGSAKDVFARSVDGRSIRFPANILRPFVLHAGIRGTFQIEFDEENRFKAITRLG